MWFHQCFHCMMNNVKIYIPKQIYKEVNPKNIVPAGKMERSIHFRKNYFLSTNDLSC